MQDYVVSSLVVQYKLRKGRYERDHNRLEVQQTGRYLVNMYLNQCMQRGSSREEP